MAAVGGDSSLLVSWDAAAGNGSDVTGYVVQWRLHDAVSYGSSNMATAAVDASSHVISGLGAYSQYTVRVAAVNAHGQGPFSEEYTAYSGAPGTVVSLAAASKVGGGFTITWQRPDPFWPNNTSYEVVESAPNTPIADNNGNTVPRYAYDIDYRRAGVAGARWCPTVTSGDLGNNILNTEISYDVALYCQGAEPVAGRTYEFRVRASYYLTADSISDQHGYWAYSEPIKHIPPLAAPTVVSGDGSLSVGWSAPGDGGGAVVSGYGVEWRSSSQSWDQAAAANQEASVTGLSHVISGLTNGVSYVVRVSATTSSGSGLASEVSALVGLPAAAVVAAVGGDSSLLVSWDAAAGNGSDVTGYVVQWRLHDAVSYGSSNMATAAVDASSHVISGLGAYSQYTVRVAAVNAHGQGPFSEEYTAYSGAPGTVVSLAAASKVGGGFTITWQRPDPFWPNNTSYEVVESAPNTPIPDDNGNTVPRYAYDIEYRRAGVAGAGWCSAAPNVDLGNDNLSTEISYDLTSYCQSAEPVAGQTYEFKVRASYYLTASSISNQHGYWAYSDAILYNPTSAATAPRMLGVVSGDGSLSLSWSVPGDGGAAVVSGYGVQWRSSSQSWVQAAAASQAATVTGLSHVISGLTNGVSYVVRVSATTSSGSGAASEVWELAGLPAATPAVAAVGGDSSLLVSWDAAAGNGSDVTGYVVQWRPHDEEGYGYDEAEAAGDASSHVISGLGADSQYAVRVAAVNAHGQGPFSEEYTAYSGAPGTVVSLAAASKVGGGFTITWQRPDPFWPNNTSYEVVESAPNTPIPDDNGNTVPRYAYDIEYRRAGVAGARWCPAATNVDLGNNNLSTEISDDVTLYCQGAEPVAGQTYEFKVRASYYLTADSISNQHGYWAYSEPITYTPN